MLTSKTGVLRSTTSDSPGIKNRGTGIGIGGCAESDFRTGPGRTCGARRLGHHFYFAGCPQWAVPCGRTLCHSEGQSGQKEKSRTARIPGHHKIGMTPFASNSSDPKVPSVKGQPLRKASKPRGSWQNRTYRTKNWKFLECVFCCS